MQQVRRIDLMWQGEDTELYEKLKQYAIELEKDIPTFIKEIIEREINHNLDR
jgi:predicted DNA-binding protein